MSTQLTIIGFSRKKGDFNGNAYDYITIHTVGKMEQKNEQRGMAGVELRADSSVLSALQVLDFSKQYVLVDADLENRAIGKGQFVTTVTSIKPILSSLAKS